jgi:hypothetical protein
MDERTTNHAIRCLVDRAAGALISRRSLVRSELTGVAANSLPSKVLAQATPVATPGAAPGRPSGSRVVLHEDHGMMGMVNALA